MPSRRADPVVSRYLERVTGLRAGVVARLRDLYHETVDPDDILGTMRTYIAEASRIIAAGQGGVATYTEGLILAIAAAEQRNLDDLPEFDVESIAGTTRDGSTLRDGMAAIGPMVLGRIGMGAPLEDALAWGETLVTRFADSEMSGARDRVLEEHSESIGAITGWEGIVQPDSCDPCKANAGLHSLTDAKYEHPDCGCEFLPVFAARGRERAEDEPAADAPGAVPTAEPIPVAEAETRLQSAFPGVATQDLAKIDGGLLADVVGQLETLREQFPEVELRAVLALPRSARGMGNRSAAATPAGVIGLNQSYWRTPAKLADDVPGWSASAGMSPGAATITHEFGHLVDFRMFGGTAGSTATPIVSDYAKTSFNERFAEAFVHYIAGDGSEAAQWVADRIAERRELLR